MLRPCGPFRYHFLTRRASRCKPSHVVPVDRFLAALIRLRAKSGKVLELFADATDVAAAWHETAMPPWVFAFLLDERGAEVQRLLSENGVPCTELVALDKVEDEHAALLRAAPSPFFKALQRLDPGADLELADDVRVACNSLSREGWGWTGDSGLQGFLVELIGLLKDRSDGFFADASRLALALRERPRFLPCRLRALLDAEGDAGTTIRAALAGAGANVDTLVSWAAVKAASDVLDAKETALYQAVVAEDLVRDRTAATIAALRGIVGSRKEGDLEGVQWARLDCVLAAALPFAVKRRSVDAGLRLFDAETLADALVDSEEYPGQLYKFLELLEDGDGVADDVRVKLAAIDLDEGKYAAATPAQVKPARDAARMAASEADKKKRKAERAAEVAAMSSKRRTRSSPPEG